MLAKKSKIRLVFMCNGNDKTLVDDCVVLWPILFSEPESGTLSMVEGSSLAEIKCFPIVIRGDGGAVFTQILVTIWHHVPRTTNWKLHSVNTNWTNNDDGKLAHVLNCLKSLHHVNNNTKISHTEVFCFLFRCQENSSILETGIIYIRFVLPLLLSILHHYYVYLFFFFVLVII